MNVNKAVLKPRTMDRTKPADKKSPEAVRREVTYTRTSESHNEDEERPKLCLINKDRFETLTEVARAIKAEGLNTCGLIFGIDYTMSNRSQGQETFGGKSLHHISESTVNPYQEVICVLGETLESINKGTIPVYGFGDAKVKGTGIFPLQSEGECDGFYDVIEVYNEVTPTIKMAGPTNFAPLIEQAINIVKEKEQYQILLIVADGQVTEEEKTIDAIVQASKYPLSIIVIGIGDGPWDVMKEFDEKLPERDFDNFNFVDFHRVKAEARNPQSAVALATLMEIPDQYKVIKQNKLLEKIHD